MNPYRYPKDWTTYLLHFDQPVQGKRHYLGIAQRQNLERRLLQHAFGSGARLTQAAVQHRSTLSVVRLWHRTNHSFERRLKANGHMRKLCPMCNPDLDQEARDQIRELPKPKWSASTWTPTTWPSG